MEKIWLQQYQPGIPAEINPDCFPSLPAMLLDSVTRYADKPAAICAGIELTYRDLDRLSAGFAAWLQSAGIGKGARVAVMLPNILQFPIAFFGILRAGMIAVGCNPLYTARELEHQLKDSGAEAIVVLDNLAAAHREVFGRTAIRWTIVTSPADQATLPALPCSAGAPPPASTGVIRLIDALEAGLNSPLGEVDIMGGDIACLQYTGGTTGLSKGAMLTHRNLVANVSQLNAWLQPALKQVEGKAAFSPGASPMYHAMGLIGFFSSIVSGRTVILIPNPRDIAGFVKTLQKYPFNTLGGSNSLLAALLDNEGFRQLDFSSLLLTTSGAMPTRMEIATKWHQVTGVPVAEAYGLSEATMLVTCNPLGISEFNGTVGVPVPSAVVTIRNADGVEVPIGEIGEVCVQGPQVMKGYWNHPEETARVMTDDKALRTGDIGRMDERGYLTIVDRAKDMIIVSGFNVYPSEIETIIAAYPGVKECAVIGVSDDKSGEVPKAFVVREGPHLTVAEIQDHCRKNLTGYKMPKFIEFIDELPKNNVGKVLRRALRIS